jgi:hypothetical protein
MAACCAAAGPPAALCTSDEPWLDGCLGGESLRAAFFRTPHWRMPLVCTRQAGTFDRVDVLHTSRWQVREGWGGGGCVVRCM